MQLYREAFFVQHSSASRLTSDLYGYIMTIEEGDFMTLEKNFSENLKSLRKKHGLTQKKLAEAIGCSEKAVSKWECALGIPDIEILLPLAKELKTTVEALFSDSGSIFLLGIDGGGTKTHFVLADADGNPLREIFKSTSNPIDIGIENAEKVLSEGIFEICGDIPFASIVCFAGIAGGTSGGTQEKLMKFFSGFNFLAFKVDTDNANIIAAGLGDEDGITLILGTGICSFLQKDGKRTQIAGRGYFIDDGGSGFDIGRDALITYYHEKDGLTEEKSEITRLISEAGFDDVQILLSRIYAEGKRFVASFSSYVYIAAKAGDNAALKIISKNMDNAATFVLANARKLGKKRIPLVLAGGLTSEPITISELRRALGIKFYFDIKILDCAPVIGAVAIAKKLYKETLK